MRQHGRRPSSTGVLLLALVVALATPVLAQASTAGSGSLAKEPGSVAAPTPTYANDDCSACCAPFPAGNGTHLPAETALSCCTPGDGRPNDLFSVANGYCVGLPCCSYGGRVSQRRQVWFPCLLFPTCANDPNKSDFCEDKATTWAFARGSSFSCTDGCCDGPMLESNVWSGVANAVPGQSNATFSIFFNPSEIKRSLFDAALRDAYPLTQIVLASPRDYAFGKRTMCTLTKLVTNETDATACGVGKMNGTTHLTVDIPPKYGDKTNESFAITFDDVTTPTGITQLNPTIHSTATDLVPIYFLFDDEGGFLYNTFYRVTPLQSSPLVSGSFVPENIYPGNSGKATLSFYSSTRVPVESIVQINFTSRWGFASDAKWTWQNIRQEQVINELRNQDGGFAVNAENTQTDETRPDFSSSGDSSSDAVAITAPETPGPKPFASSKFKSRVNQWTLTLDKEWQPGWITLVVDQVQNPVVYYSGLNLATVAILDGQERLISAGVVSAISVELVSEPVTSPYNYVSIVVLIGTLLFCTVVIRGNGLSFSMGSIWTDLTAICTVCALIVAIINNLIWAMLKSSVYFYLSRVFLCFTFTMLTAVCFHWGTVLSLHLRRYPPVRTVVLFVTLNLSFYLYQAAFLFYHQDLITRVYETESNSYSYANQQCKDNDGDFANSVFSDIQGYLWSCYAENQDKFFLVSTTVTSALFLGLTIIVMALGFMVMRRGKHLLGTSTGPHQVVLVKALRLYYTLIGIVTVVYLLSWIVQLMSRSRSAISYPWFYIFTVWLPQSIPPCCLIFLQWNSTAKSLKDTNFDESTSSRLTDTEFYDEIRTPSFAFSSDRWSEEDGSDYDDDDHHDSIVELGDNKYGLVNRAPGEHHGGHAADDFIGLSMSLETNEEFPLGCFVAIQRLQIDPLTGANVWRQISNTDTVEASRKDLSGPVTSGRHVYSFMAVPRIPLSGAFDDRVRLVVYSVNAGHVDTTRTDHHSEMTVKAVLAAMDRRSSGDDESSTQFSMSTCEESSSVGDIQASRVIDELFEVESEPDSTDGLNSLLTSLSIVAEFTVSTDVLVTSGARSELVALITAEHSYKQFGLDSLPPKMSVHTVLPKAARTKYGLAGVASGMMTSHSISSQYHIRELGLLVVEDLTESRFSNWIPRQILEVIIRHRSKQFIVAQNDLARLEAFDRQRQKGTDRGIYENLIQQIQDDGDITRCREWMIQRCQQMKEYVDLLRRLRRLYVSRDNRKEYFKPSTEKKNSLLRFLPINLHLQEMWVGSATASFNSDDNKAQVYDIVTVGAMAAHVYKFKNGGLLSLEEQRSKMHSRRREPFGSMGMYRQSPLWTEAEQKAESFDWEVQKRMDVCFPQAVAALVTAFTRKIDLALQNAHEGVGREMLEHLEKLGFLFNVESLVSTHGNEAGMLEDMAGALKELRNVRFVLVDEHHEQPKDARLSFDIDEETKDGDDDSEEFTQSNPTGTSLNDPLAGVVDVNVFTSVDQALAEDDKRRDGNVPMLAPPSPANSTSSSSFSNVGNRLIRSFIRAKSGILHGGAKPPSTHDHGRSGFYGFTTHVIRVKVRTTRIKLPGSLTYGGTISVTPVLFTQGINEKQTIANNTGHSATRIQDAINENSLQLLRSYSDRYCCYIQTLRTRGTWLSVSSSAITREQITVRLAELSKLISSSKQARKKRPEILQLSSDLCREIGGGRVTVCKSAKDRTGMSVTLEQGRILVQHHRLPEAKKSGIVSVMRSEGVRIENALKNTGRRMFAFNALQRSLLPEEYRCPPQTAGKNVS